MKRRLKVLVTAFLMIIALCMSIFACMQAYGIGWTTTEVVSTESTEDSLFPSLGVGSDGPVHIAWHDDTDYGGAGFDDDVFYKMFVPGS